MTVRIKGGLLGHWSVWTSSAPSSCSTRIQAAVARRHRSRPTLLALDSQVTDCNAAVFDVANDFHGVHRRLPRDPAPPGSARGHLVPRPERDARARSDGGDRPRLRILSAPQRRRLRARQPRKVAGVMRHRHDPHPVPRLPRPCDSRLRERWGGAREPRGIATLFAGRGQPSAAGGGMALCSSPSARCRSS